MEEINITIILMNSSSELSVKIYTKNTFLFTQKNFYLHKKNS